MYNVANRAFDRLAQSLTSNGTALKVYDATPFPDPPFLLSIEDEIVEVTKVNSTTLTIVRGKEGTTPGSYAQGTMVRNRFTAGTFKALQDAVAGIETMEEHGNEWHTEEFETTEGAQAKASQALSSAKGYAVAKTGDTMTGDLEMGTNAIVLGGKFRLVFNSSINSLDIEVIE